MFQATTGRNFMNTVKRHLSSTLTPHVRITNLNCNLFAEVMWHRIKIQIVLSIKVRREQRARDQLNMTMNMWSLVLPTKRAIAWGTAIVHVKKRNGQRSNAHACVSKQEVLSW